MLLVEDLFIAFCGTKNDFFGVVMSSLIGCVWHLCCVLPLRAAPEWDGLLYSFLCSIKNDLKAKVALRITTPAPTATQICRQLVLSSEPASAIPDCIRFTL